MEKGFTLEQLKNKLDALEKFPPEYLNFIGCINRTNAIKRIRKKINAVECINLKEE